MASSSPTIFSALHKLRSLLNRQQKIKWLVIVSFAICISLLEVITASFIIIFAQVLNDPSLGQYYLSKIGLSKILSANQVIFYIAITCALLYLIKNSLAGIEVFYQNITIQKMNFDFKNALLKRYAETDYALYLTRNSALGLQIVAGDTELMFSKGLVSCASILSEGIIFFCLIFMMVWMNPSLALIVFGIGGILIVAVTKGLLPLFYRWGKKLQLASVSASQHLTQFFHAFKEIVLLGKRDAFVSAYEQYSLKRANIQALHTATNALPRMVIELLFVVLFVITVACLCMQQESSAKMLGTLGGYLYVGFRIMPGLNRIITQLNDFKATIPAIERVHHEYHLVTAKDNYCDIPNFVFQKTITVNNVSYQYPNTGRKVLSQLNLTIYAGECIGIAGETGSGKSTLVDILLGLLRPIEGSVLVDDQFPVYAYQWHQQIGYVPQSVYLTDDTIEANIAFGEGRKEIDQVKLQNAIDRAQLRKLMDHLPEGAQTIVGERGVRLSGGERQRIAIARVLYQNPKVIIFDEATSALDSDTESRLMDTIYSISQHCTVIMIAHRLTTLRQCNRIVIMEAGCIKKIVPYSALEPTFVET